MCNPFMLEITREIPYKIKKCPQNMDKNEIKELQDKIIEFCKEPRSIEEIKEYTKLENSIDTIRGYTLKPLIMSGRLKYTHEYKCHYNQRYIDARVEVTQEMLDNIKAKADTLTPERIEKILDFCKTPKGLREIEECIQTKNALQYVRKLVMEGKLKLTHPDIPSYLKQKYFNAESNCEQFTDQAVADYCIEPRTKQEIETHFNLTKPMRKGVVQRLINSGKICYTEDSKQLGKCDGNRRLIKIG